VTALTPTRLNQIASAAVEKIEALVECWDSKKKSAKDIEIGQVVFAPVSDTVLRHKVADVVRSDPFTHGEAVLRFRSLDDRTDFRPKPDRLPIAALQLSETEELLMHKGKQRPVVVLAKSAGVAPSNLPEGEQRNKGQNAFKPIYCVAPVFSCSTGNKTTAFGPVMAARIKCMMYPEFLFAPSAGNGIDCDSVVRLDRAFWTHLQCATNPLTLFMSDAMLAIAWDQMQVMASVKPSENYLELRELLLEELPKECC